MCSTPPQEQPKTLERAAEDWVLMNQAADDEEEKGGAGLGATEALLEDERGRFESRDGTSLEEDVSRCSSMRGSERSWKRRGRRWAWSRSRRVEHLHAWISTVFP